MAVSAEELGTEDIKNLIKQAAPASIGIHVRQYTSRYYICWTMDRFTCYRGCNCGLTNNILYFIVRMAIGIERICSLEPLVKKPRKSKSHFANQIMMTFFLRHFLCYWAFFLVLICYCFFGAKGP
jgi:hypothetical protein